MSALRIYDEDRPGIVLVVRMISADNCCRGYGSTGTTALMSAAVGGHPAQVTWVGQPAGREARTI